ncbi:MAG: cyclic nucleotide-binding domain-containing protein [Anaerolinea sp.]|nr:cyclic nucleotide-binding domain-containing protein [Anaerolinea sp.]MCC6976124.1 cyclic nucleotide-binding domain-containing protein [Anaerolineae bacterium]
MAIQALELLERAFPTISREHLLQLAELAQVRHYPPNTVLCREGAYEQVLYLISEGKCSITKRLTEKEDMFLRLAVPGDYVGEMAIISDAPRSATVTTLEDVVALEIDRELFLQILRQNADLALSIIRMTFDRLRINDKNAIEGLREAYHTLEKLDKAKLDFIEVTAHELRTPLTIMRGYASMMLADPVIRENQVLREMVEGVVNGSQRLHEIVNNMLDVQRIDMEQLNVASVPVSLPVVLRGVEMEFRHAIQQRKLNLIMDIARDTSILYIEADPGLLSKAMHHVLMNAIKYTPDGGTIRIKLVYETHPELGRIAHIMVSDTGIGIDQEHHKLIFEKFYRLGDVALHSSGQTAYKAGGPGLGLAIARGAVMAHQGQIWVESPGFDEQKFPGTTFHLILPIQPPQRTAGEGVKKQGRL